MNPMILHTAVDLLSPPPHPLPSPCSPDDSRLLSYRRGPGHSGYNTCFSGLHSIAPLVLAFLHIDNCATRYASHRNGPSPVCCSRLDLMTTLP